MRVTSVLVPLLFGGDVSAWGHAATAGGSSLVYDPSVVDLRDVASSSSTEEVASRAGVDIAALIANMTLEEKIAQMTQLDIYSMMNGDDRNPATALNTTVTEHYARLGIGSILNAPFPGPIDGRTGWSAAEWRSITDQIKAIYRTHSKTPMIYGIDTIHGATYTRGATLFGQPLSAASSFNLELVHRMGEIEAKDTLAGGIPWVFSPVLGIAVQPKWSRVYETFGEDPHLAAQMGASIIRGIQSSGKVAACMKHFIGYSNPIDGLDRADNVITDWDLVNYFAPSFLAAAQAGVKTAMETYVSINGQPVIASHKILTDLLRHDMKFDGMLVSDYSEIDRMFFEHHLVPSVDEAVRVSLTETSLDMNMGPRYQDFFKTMEHLVQHGQVTEARLDESVRRILTLKEELGLFEDHLDFGSGEPGPSVDEVGSQEDQKVALNLARESVILLKNDKNVLPLALGDGSSPASIFLTGPISNNKGFMCGGWSVFWPGSSNSSHFPNGQTIKDALVSRVGTAARVQHLDVVDVAGNYSKSDMERALAIAAQSKYTVVVVGEGNYAEKQGDIQDLSLPQGQREYLRALTKVKATQVIVVIVSGRPRILHGAHAEAEAVLASFLPCEQGGQAIVEVIVGDINPSGKLPITYPLHSGNSMPYFHRVNTVCDGWKDCPIEWPFGYGLSYSEFVYSSLTLNTTNVKTTDKLRVEVTVTNHGAKAGLETVLLFINQVYRRASVPEAKLLKQFQKIHLNAGESKEVIFVLSIDDWGYYNPHIGRGFHRETERGEYVISFPSSVRTSSDGDASGVRRPASGAAVPVGDRGGHATTLVSGPSAHSSVQTLEKSFFVVA